MPWRKHSFVAFLTLLLGGLLLSACEREQQLDLGKDTEFPAMWEITDQEGTVEGWLFGTIHALPDGAKWRSPRFQAISEGADMLVVEVSGLGNGDAISKIFNDLAFDNPPVPLADRITPAHRPQFDALLVKSKVRSDYFDGMESWAAALALAQVAQTGSAENGVDRALLGDFADREIIELEGAQAQLAIFDSLPEKEQRDLINAVLEESAAYEKDQGILARTWKRGDIAQLEKLTQRGILADPELKQALLINRNEAWAAQVENLLSAEAKPLIAVGAGHLLGERSLPKLLEERGYSVRRIQ